MEYSLFKLLNDLSTRKRNVVNGFVSWKSSDDTLADRLNVWFDRNQTNSDFTKVSVTFEQYKIDRKSVDPKEVYYLAKDFGGNRFLRMLLGDNDSSLSRALFDITVFDSTIHYSDLARPNNRSYIILGELSKILKINLDSETKKGEINTTAEDIMALYTLMNRTGYYPSIGSGSENRDFHVFQFKFPRKIIATYLHLTVGYRFSDQTIKEDDINLLECVLAKHGFNFLEKQYNYWNLYS